MSVITGPFTKTFITSPTRHRSSVSYRQSRPYRKRLAYEMRDRKTVALHPAFVPSSDVTSTLATLCATPNRNLVLDKAYNRFMNTIKNSANDEGSQLLVGLAERKQSITMMASRLKQVTSFAKALKSFNFSLAGEALGLTEIKGRRRRTALGERYEFRTREGKVHTSHFRTQSKAFANNFLEFHFGWEPLVKDIWGAVNLLQSGVPPHTVRERAKGDLFVKRVTPGLGITTYDRWYNTRIQLQAEISVSNPNLWLANQLGLVNPASVAMELVPFSFIVGWFTNLGSFMNQWSDFFGLSVSEATTTQSGTYVEEGLYYGRYNGILGYYKTTRSDYVYMKRAYGIEKPAFLIKPFKGLSVTRGVTAVALLLQVIKDGESQPELPKNLYSFKERQFYAKYGQYYGEKARRHH